MLLRLREDPVARRVFQKTVQILGAAGFHLPKVGRLEMDRGVVCRPDRLRGCDVCRNPWRVSHGTTGDR